MPIALPQDELRRRLRAARILRSVTLKELADRLDRSERLSERTLRKLENGESDVSERSLRPIAQALQIPYEWFIVEDVFISASNSDDAFEQRLISVQRGIAEVLRHLAQPPADTPPPAKPRSPRRTRRVPSP